MSAELGLDGATIKKLMQIGGSEFVTQMIDLFMSYVPQKLAEARSAVQAGDLVGVAKAVHPIKSSAANIGAHSMHDLAERIEQLARDQRGESISHLLFELEGGYQQVQVQLRHQRNELTSERRSLPHDSK